MQQIKVFQICTRPVYPHEQTYRSRKMCRSSNNLYIQHCTSLIEIYKENSNIIRIINADVSSWRTKILQFNAPQF